MYLRIFSHTAYSRILNPTRYVSKDEIAKQKVGTTVDLDV
jgi:hypothetical protein